MGCEQPSREQKPSYYTVVAGIVVESLCLLIALVAVLMGLGFPSLRAAASLALVGAIVAVSTSSAYPCCCARGESRGVFYAFVALATVFSVIALIVAAAAPPETPCVRHDCYYATCDKCQDRGRHDCDPDYSYYCTHDHDVYPQCGDVRWCNNWDADCSKSGVDDDHWFWGYESRGDCEKHNNVRDLRRGARGSTLAATIVALIFRALVVAVVWTAPTKRPASAVVDRQPELHIPVAEGIELAPVVTIVRRADDDATATGGGETTNPVGGSQGGGDAREPHVHGATRDDHDLPQASFRGDLQYGVKAY